MLQDIIKRFCPYKSDMTRDLQVAYKQGFFDAYNYLYDRAISSFNDAICDFNPAVRDVHEAIKRFKNDLKD